MKSAWRPEDPGRIVREHPFFRPFPAGAPDTDVRLGSVAWRTDALIGLAAAGVFTLEDAIVDVTRDLFHSPGAHQGLSERLLGRRFDAIHEWIDTVPGSGVRGGGIVHRLEHGHDLEAARAIYERHGLEGLLVWTQHVTQDLASPTGIPLPVGADAVAARLEALGVTRGNAALVVSLNMAELAASFLAGVFLLRLATLLARMQGRHRVKKRVRAAADAREAGDLDAVVANYEEAFSLTEGDPGIALALGWAYAESNRPRAESFLNFRYAAKHLAIGDRLLNLHGVEVSLRGLASMLALTQADQVLERDDTWSAWREELEALGRGAVVSFERAAVLQLEKPSVTVRDTEMAWRPRPLSAAVNRYLAARVARSAPFLPSAAEGDRLTDRALEAVVRARAAYPEVGGDVERAERRWRVELSAPAGPRRGRLPGC
ncbi:MAG: hypothetical protein ACOC8B_00505 [Gemmatimonadota bacterium]